MESIFKEKIKEEADDLINKLKECQSDPLSIGNRYYKKEPKKYFDEYFKDTPVEIEVDLNINKFGILFEVIK